MTTQRTMWKVYLKMDTQHLKTLRSRKFNKLQTLKGFNNFWAVKDRTRLEFQIKEIDAELNARNDQLPLPL